MEKVKKDLKMFFYPQPHQMGATIRFVLITQERQDNHLISR